MSASIDPVEDDPLLAQLLDYIRSLPEGTKLTSERSMEERWGVSRSALRPRMRTLESAGVIERRATAGSFSRKMRPEDVARVMAIGLASHDLDSEISFRPVRLALEREAAARAALRAPGDAISRMRESLSALATLPPGPERGAADTAFHNALFEASGEPALQFMYGAIRPLFDGSVLHRLDRLEFVERGLDDSHRLHVEVLAAIESGDPELAKRSIDQLIAQDLD